MRQTVIRISCAVLAGAGALLAQLPGASVGVEFAGLGRVVSPAGLQRRDADATESAPKLVVYAVHTGRARGALPGAADHLSQLQRRVGGRGVQVVAVVDGDGVDAAPDLRPAHLAVDAGGKVTQAWFGADWDGGMPVLVIDPAGNVLFRGDVGGALDDAVELALAGRLDPKGELEFRLGVLALASGFQSTPGAIVHGRADELLQRSPRLGMLHALRFLAASQKELDAKAAEAALANSLVVLANEPRALAEFADLALRGTPQRSALGARLAPALAGATAAAPNDVAVQLAHLRALTAAGKARLVRQKAVQLRPLAFATGDRALEFAEILANDAAPAEHKELCAAALRRAEELGCRLPWFDGVRYAVARRCAGDAATADAVLAANVAHAASRTGINNRCWYLMTDIDKMGRCEPLAAALAERMLVEREQMDGFEFDTAAMAMFLAGKPALAVELQHTAIGAGPLVDPAYAERLSRYEAAVQAARPR